MNLVTETVNMTNTRMVYHCKERPLETHHRAHRCVWLQMASKQMVLYKSTIDSLEP
jgi:hypothetical protein